MGREKLQLVAEQDAGPITQVRSREARMATILVIDDSPTVVAFARRHLTPHRVEWLSSFVALPAQLRNDPPDLVILDLRMPAMAGVAVARFVQQHQLHATPIVVYSSEDAATLAASAREIHAAAAVQKSADPTELVQTVLGILRGARVAAV